MNFDKITICIVFGINNLNDYELLRVFQILNIYVSWETVLSFSFLETKLIHRQRSKFFPLSNGNSKVKKTEMTPLVKYCLPLSPIPKPLSNPSPVHTLFGRNIKPIG